MSESDFKAEVPPTMPEDRPSVNQVMANSGQDRAECIALQHHSTVATVGKLNIFQCILMKRDEVQVSA